MRIFFRATMVVIIILFLSPVSCNRIDDKAMKAVTAANAWLTLVDNGEYEKSWDESAAYFRKAVTKALWKEQLSAVRNPLGNVLDRKLRSAKYTSSLPGAPDGEYVVIQYETTFKNKKSSIETVTPMKEANGAWKVSGYYIK